MTETTRQRQWVVHSNLRPGQAEELVAMAVPVLREILFEHRRKQAVEADEPQPAVEPSYSSSSTG